MDKILKKLYVYLGHIRDSAHKRDDVGLAKWDRMFQDSYKALGSHPDFIAAKMNECRMCYVLARDELTTVMPYANRLIESGDEVFPEIGININGKPRKPGKKI